MGAIETRSRLPCNERREGQKIMNKEAVRLTLSMFRDNSQVEAFLDAVPGYFRDDDDASARSHDISPLLKRNGVVLTLGQRMMRHAATVCYLLAFGLGTIEGDLIRHRQRIDLGPIGPVKSHSPQTSSIYLATTIPRSRLRRRRRSP
jgi:hypothetical protein